MTAYELRISDWSSDVCSSDLNRAHDRGQGADRARLPRALDAGRVARRRHREALDRDRGDILGPRHGILHEGRRQELAGFRVVDGLLHQRLAQPLADAAADLPFDEPRVDHPADVIDDDVALELDGARVAIGSELS